MIDLNEVYIYGDQPATCPICGIRTEIIIDLYFTIEKTQIHKCREKECDYEFVMQEDN